MRFAPTKFTHSNSPDSHSSQSNICNIKHKIKTFIAIFTIAYDKAQ